MLSSIPTCFSDNYSAETSTASMKKLAPVARAAEAAGYVTLHDPGLIDREKLRSLHDPDYVRAFITGKGDLAASQGWKWTAKIRTGVLAINAGQLEGARMAMQHRIAANVAQGFHHAKPERGWYFCTFNGLALVALEFPEKRIFVLDCDEHCGDGRQSSPRDCRIFLTSPSTEPTGECTRVSEASADTSSRGKTHSLITRRLCRKPFRRPRNGRPISSFTRPELTPMWMIRSVLGS